MGVHTDEQLREGLCEAQLQMKDLCAHNRAERLQGDLKLLGNAQP